MSSVQPLPAQSVHACLHTVYPEKPHVTGIHQSRSSVSSPAWQPSWLVWSSAVCWSEGSSLASPTDPLLMPLKLCVRMCVCVCVCVLVLHTVAILSNYISWQSSMFLTVCIYFGWGCREPLCSTPPRRQHILLVLALCGPFHSSQPPSLPPAIHEPLNIIIDRCIAQSKSG